MTSEATALLFDRFLSLPARQVSDLDRRIEADDLPAGSRAETRRYLARKYSEVERP